MQEKIKIEKISDIVPLFNGERTISQVIQMIEPKKTEVTISRWIKKLREAGYTVLTRPRGQRGLSI